MMRNVGKVNGIVGKVMGNVLIMMGNLGKVSYKMAWTAGWGGGGALI